MPTRLQEIVSAPYTRRFVSLLIGVFMSTELVHFTSAAELVLHAREITPAAIEALCADMPMDLRYGLADFFGGTSRRSRLLHLPSGARVKGSLIWDFGADAESNPECRVDALVIEGDLELDGDLLNLEGDYGPSLLVLGRVRAGNFVHGGGIWVIEGDVEVEQVVLGHYNHGQCRIGGSVRAALLMRDDHDLVVLGRCNTMDTSAALAQGLLVDEVFDMSDFDPSCEEDQMYDLIRADLVIERINHGLPVLRDVAKPPRLVDALLRGDPDLLERALSDGAGVEQLLAHARRPLMLAVRRSQTPLVERLLQAGANVEAEDEEGLRALHHAADSGFPEVVRLLLDAGASIDAHARDGSTPLQRAIHSNHGAVARLLLERGARTDWPRAQSRKLIEACFAAPFNGRGEVDDALIIALLDVGIDLDTPERRWPTPLLAAAGRSSVELLKRVLVQDSWPPTSGHGKYRLSPLHYAALHARIDHLELLLQQPWSRAALESEQGLLALALALRGQPLLYTLEDPKNYPLCPFLDPELQPARLAVLYRLIEVGVSPQGSLEGVPLAAFSADPRVLEALLRAGASALQCTASGGSLLLMTVSSAPPQTDLALLRLLLAHGADPLGPALGFNAGDALSATAAGGDLDLIEAMLDALPAHTKSTVVPVNALLDIAAQARERNREMIVIQNLLATAVQQHRVSHFEIMGLRPQLLGDAAHLEADRAALEASRERVLARWPELSKLASTTHEGFRQQREDDARILLDMRRRHA